MKKILLILAAAAILTGCATDDSPPLRSASVGYDMRWFSDDINATSGGQPSPYYVPYRH